MIRIEQSRERSNSSPAERGALVMLQLRMLVYVAIFSTICIAGDVREGWRTYRSSDYGFTIDYPANMTFYPGHPDYAETQISYMPTCDYTTVACFEYNGKEYENTTFEAAGLSINVLRDIKTEQDCAKIDAGSHPIKTETINGNRFHYGVTGEAGMSQSAGGPTYRAFHQNVCFEIAAAIAQVSAAAFDDGAINSFDSRKLDKLLEKMIHSFRFSGAVEDGPGWKVYDDNKCGGIYEYLEGETVQTTIEYSNKRLHSNEIACSRHFTHHGLYYKVAATETLKDKGQLEAWLKASNYPDLSKAQVVVSSKYCTEYKAEPYYYIFGQATLYILSVSDAKHRVVAAHDDPVFNHLLNSFKVE